MPSKYHTTKDGKKARKGLYYYMNRKKKAGTSNPKSKSTVSAKAYKNMKAGFPKFGRAQWVIVKNIKILVVV